MASNILPPDIDEIIGSEDWKTFTPDQRNALVDDWAIQARNAQDWSPEELKGLDDSVDYFRENALETFGEQAKRIVKEGAVGAVKSLAVLPLAVPKLGLQSGKLIGYGGDPNVSTRELVDVAPEVAKMGVGLEQTGQGLDNLRRQYDPFSNADEEWEGEFDSLRQDILNRNLSEDPDKLYDYLKKKAFNIAKQNARFYGGEVEDYMPQEFQGGNDERIFKEYFNTALQGKRPEGFIEFRDDTVPQQGLVTKNQSRSLVTSPENLGLLMKFSATRNPMYFEALKQRLGRSRERQISDAVEEDIEDKRGEGDFYDDAARTIFSAGGYFPEAGQEMVEQTRSMASSPVDMASTVFSFGLGKQALKQVIEKNILKSIGTTAKGVGTEFVEGALSGLQDESVPTAKNVIEEGLMEAVGGGAIQAAGAATGGVREAIRRSRLPVEEQVAETEPLLTPEEQSEITVPSPEVQQALEMADQLEQAESPLTAEVLREQAEQQFQEESLLQPEPEVAPVEPTLTDEQIAASVPELNLDELTSLEVVSTGTSESDVYRRGNEVIKVAEEYNAPETIGARVRDKLLADKLLGDGNVRLEGYYRGRKGILNPVFAEPYIEGRGATQQEIDSMLEQKGFVPHPTKKGRYLIESNGKIYEAQDLDSGNVLVDQQGVPHVIDASVFEIENPTTEELQAVSNVQGTRLNQPASQSVATDASQTASQVAPPSGIEQAGGPFTQAQVQPVEGEVVVEEARSAPGEAIPPQTGNLYTDNVLPVINEYAPLFPGVIESAAPGGLQVRYDTGALVVDPEALMSKFPVGATPQEIQSLTRTLLDEEFRHYVSLQLEQSSPEFARDLSSAWASLPKEVKNLSSQIYGRPFETEKEARHEFFRQYWQNQEIQDLTESALRRDTNLMERFQSLLDSFIAALKRLQSGAIPEVKPILDRLISQAEQKANELRSQATQTQQTDATTQIHQQEGVSTEPESGDQGRKTTKTGSSNRVLSEEGGQEEVTSLKRATVDAERASRGAEAIPTPKSKGWSESEQEAAQQLRDDPRAGKNLLESIRANPRPLTQTENALLLFYKVEVSNDLEQAAKRVTEAQATGEQEKISEAMAAYNDVATIYNDIDVYSRMVGTESGRSLNARKMAKKLEKKDVSLAALTQKYRTEVKDGEALTSEEIASVKKHADELTKALEKVDSLTEEEQKIAAQPVERKISQEALKDAREARTQKKGGVKKLLADKKKEALERLKSRKSQKKVEPPKPQTFSPGLSPTQLTAFVETVGNAARSVPEKSRWGDDKVFLSDMYDQWSKSHPGVSLNDFKLMLIEARGMIELGRLDLVEALTAEQRQRMNRSIIPYFDIEWSLMRLPRNRGLSAPEITPEEQDFLDQAIVGASFIEEGASTKEKFQTKMVEEFGNDITPQIDPLYNKAVQLHKEAVESVKKEEEKAKEAAKPSAVLEAGKKRLEGKPTDKIDAALAVKLFKAHVRARPSLTPEQVNSAVTENLKEIYPNITESDTRVAITDYGKAKWPSKDALKQRESEYKRILRLIESLERIQGGQQALKSGLQRSKPSARERELTVQIKEAMKKFKVETTAENQLATTKKAITNRLKNQIEDLNRIIDGTAKPKTPREQIEYDAEMNALVKERDALKKYVDDLTGPSPEGKWNQKAQAAAKASAEYYRRKIEQKDFTARSKPNYEPTEATLKLQEEAKAAKEEFQDLKDLSGETQKEQLAAQKARLEKEIEKVRERLITGEKPPAGKPKATNAEIQSLKDTLKNLRESVRLVEGTSTQSDARKAENARKMLERSIDRMEKEIARREQDNRTLPKEKREQPDSPELRALRERRDVLRETVDALKEAETPRRIPEEIALDNFKRRVERLQYEARNMSQKQEYLDLPSDARANDLKERASKAKYELEQAKKSWNNDLLDRKLASRSGARKVFDRGVEALNLSRSILTSLDLSAVLRQGGFLALANPKRLAEAFGPMLKSFVSDKARYDAMEKIKNDPDFAAAQRAKLFLSDINDADLSKMEEAFFSRWVDKIPGWAGGGLLRGSQRAYTTFLNVIRFSQFKAMKRALEQNGRITLEEGKALANFINVASGRGVIGLSDKQQANPALATIFFSPRLVSSRFNLLFGQPLYGGTMRTRKLVAMEYAKFLIGVTAALGLAALMRDPDDEEKFLELDPRSADFLKARFGNSRLDLFGGLLQATVLLSRLVTGETKTLSGEEVALRDSLRPLELLRELQGQSLVGDKPKMGADALSVLGRFLRSKLSPVAGSIGNMMVGEDYLGRPTNIQNEAQRMLVPMSFGSILDAMQEQGIPRGTALSILSLFGAGLQTYKPKED